MRADHVVLPGVGAFGACADEIDKRNLVPVIKEVIDAGKPFLGVCVGMQLLFDVSEEMGMHKGLGVLPGRIVRFKHSYAPAMAPAGVLPEEETAPTSSLKIPHMGWNTAIPANALLPCSKALKRRHIFILCTLFTLSRQTQMTFLLLPIMDSLSLYGPAEQRFWGPVPPGEKP